jgi:GT2 family glycosyltransferase
MRIAALITCHNRKSATLACLDALFQSALPKGYSLDVYLVDDGSTDGTGEEVLNRYPTIRLIKGDGSLYWNGGMRVAFDAALATNAEFYFWLNDDTLLYRDAVDKLLSTAQSMDGQFCSIAVGTTHARFGCAPTYGGLRRIGKGLSHRAELVVPQTTPVECEQMNGNCVLVPSRIAQVVGNLDRAFIHNLGDIDYGMRARAAGYKLLVIPGYAGTCSRNSVSGTHLDRTLGLHQRLTKVFSKKCFPVRPWLVFTWRYGGPLWPLYWLKPYFDVVFGAVCRRRT